MADTRVLSQAGFGGVGLLVSEESGPEYYSDGEWDLSRYVDQAEIGMLSSVL